MFVQLTIVVLAALTGPMLSAGRRGAVPVVVGELAAGVALGHTGAGVLDPRAGPLPTFSALGFAMLMLTAGTHVDIGSPAIHRGFLRGLAAFAVVAVTAIPAGLLIDHGVGLGHPALLTVLVAGSSAAVAFPIIEERGLSGDAVALLVSWVAIADSVTVVVMPLTLAGSADVAEALAGDVAIVAAGVTCLLLATRLRHTATSRRLEAASLTRHWALQLRLSVLMLLGLCAIAERTGASTLVAGFLAGMVLTRLREPDRLSLQLAGLANGFFVPAFFVLLGAELDLRALVGSPSRVVLAGALAAAAVTTHLIAARATSGRAPALATGLASTAQLGMPAAAASLGLAGHLLTPADAAALVAAGCLTLVPATVGALMLGGGGAPADPPAPVTRHLRRTL
jgi:Kef-type K+ transport system membrane component KefB